MVLGGWAFYYERGIPVEARGGFVDIGLQCHLRPLCVCTRERGQACLSICTHDHFTPTREIERHIRALAHNQPEEYWDGDETLALRQSPTLGFVQFNLVTSNGGDREALHESVV